VRYHALHLVIDVQWLTAGRAYIAKTLVTIPLDSTR
jgi:hypothetical protein